MRDLGTRRQVSITFAGFCGLVICLTAVPVRAQHGGSGGGGSRGGTGSGGGTSTRTVYAPTAPVAQPNAEPGEIIPTTQATQKPAIVEDESCLPWELPNANATSVSAVRLGVTNKARSQYEKACSAFKKKKLTEAEQHARDAIQQYPKYPAAWVMLGKVLGDQQKMDEAHDACSQPLKADPTYLPPYLCLAGLLDVEKRWDDLLAWSDRFRGMNQTGDIYSDYYRALSFFHLHKLPDAQKSASEAIAKDSLHHQPGLYFLLAQIYGQQGDVANAAAQVQQFVKYAGNKQDKDAAKEYLSELQTRQSAKESQP